MKEPAWSQKILMAGGFSLLPIVALLFMLKSNVPALVAVAGAVRSALMPVFPALDFIFPTLVPIFVLVTAIEKSINFTRLGAGDHPEPFFNVVGGICVPLAALWLLLWLRA